MDVQPRVNRTECALLRPNSQQPEASASHRPGNRFTEADREIIARYYEGRWPRARAPRLHGRTRPRKRWVIGSRVSQGLRTAPLPRELEQALSALDPGYERMLVGAEILCVDTTTSQIVDVMRGSSSSRSEDTPHLLLDSSPHQSLAISS